MVKASWLGDASLQQDLAQSSITASTRNPPVDQKLLEERVKPAGKQSKLKQTWTLWHEPKHTRNSTKDWLQTKRLKTLHGDRKRPDCDSTGTRSGLAFLHHVIPIKKKNPTVYRLQKNKTSKFPSQPWRSRMTAVARAGTRRMSGSSEQHSQAASSHLQLERSHSVRGSFEICHFGMLRLVTRHVGTLRLVEEQRRNITSGAKQAIQAKHSSPSVRLPPSLLLCPSSARILSKNVLI